MNILSYFSRVWALALSIIVSLTLLSSPAWADAAADVSPIVTCPHGTPIFDNVRLGITPTGWSNSDDTSIDLAPPIPYEQILDEMALTGFKGSQMAPKYPQNPTDLLAALEPRGLVISEPWVGTTLTTEPFEVSQKAFDEQLAFMQAMGENTIVVAELGGAVHQDKTANPLTDRPHFTEEQWQALTEGLNRLGQQAAAAGMKFVYHPHVGTGVMVLEEIDRLMEQTNPEYLQLLLDTGHLYYGGVTDVEAVARKYAHRIKHVHLKNIRQGVLDASIANGTSFLDSIKNGVFTVPGDYAGAIDFQPILDVLAAKDYEGWLIVEAEQDPNKANPLAHALLSRYYLCEATGQ